MTDKHDEGTIEVQKRTRRWGVVIFHDMIQNTDLTYDARMLWIILESFSSNEQLGVMPPVRTLCRLMNRKDVDGSMAPAGRHKVFRLLKELETKGYLERTQCRENGRLTSNLYRMVDKPL